MKKENIIETLLSIGILVIICMWFLIVHKLFSNMDTVREQCSKNMNSIYSITITYDTKLADLKSSINNQQSQIERLEERISKLEAYIDKLKNSSFEYAPQVEEENNE